MQAQVQNRVGRNTVHTFDFDKIGQKIPLNLPSASKTFSSKNARERTDSTDDMSDVPDSLKDRVASVLASSDFSKKVDYSLRIANP